MEYLKTYFKTISIPNFTLSSLIEILIIIFVLYKLFSNIKDSRTWTIIKGLCVFFVFYLISVICDFHVITTIFQSALYIMVVGIIVLFSTEIKKILEGLGGKKFKKNVSSLFKEKENFSEETKETLHTIKEVVTACKTMSKDKTGSLILFEKNSSLSEYEATGINIDSAISSQLILNIFEHNTPLHDGAMIIKENRIVSATCYLPLSENLEINKKLGTRHRAGIGVSEVTDCIVVIVSEETGGISICKKGEIEKVNPEELEEKLKNYLLEEDNFNPIHGVILRKNWKTILFSIIVSLLLWISIFNYKDPTITKSFTIPVTVINETAISSVNQTYKVVEGDTVSFKISGKNSIVKDLSADNFKAIADLSKLSYVYAVPIEVTTTMESIKDRIEITVTRNDTMKVTLDEVIEADIDVVAYSTGTVGKGYKLKELVPEVSKITIKGPKSKISKIKEASTIINISNLKETTKVNAQLTIFDKNGDIIDISDCIINKSNIEIMVVLYNTKTVDLKVTTTGTPMKNYRLKSFTPDITSVDIAGNNVDLKDVTEINATIDISEISANTSKMINIKEFLPENIELVDEDLTVTVALELEEFKTREFTLKSEDIIVKNLNEKFVCKLIKAETSVTISAIQEILDNLKIEDLEPYIDASNLEEGEYNLNLQFTNTSDVSIPEIPKIEIKIEKKK